MEGRKDGPTAGEMNRWTEREDDVQKQLKTRWSEEMKDEKQGESKSDNIISMNSKKNVEKQSMSEIFPICK